MADDFYSDFTGQTYSKSEFINILTKRIKKDLRNRNPLKLKQTYALYENGAKTQIISLFLEIIFKKRLDLVILPSDSKLQANNLDFLGDDCLETYISKRLGIFFKSQNISNLTDNKINILRTITYKELVQIKNIFNISGTLENENLEFVEKLNEEYSQTKASLLKSFNHIDYLLRLK